MYRALDSSLVIETIDVLRRRIAERFPSSGLSEVCAELHAVAVETQARCERIEQPNRLLRYGVIALIVLTFGALIYTISLLDISWRSVDAAELLTVSEAAMNDLVLIGAAVFFLVTTETRVKRRRALAALDELRSIAHVIEMHQLTKDPSTLLRPGVLTPSSPKRTFTAFELARYLDYCSEMMSLTGKVAALYAQHFRDEVVLGAVNDIETLCTGISRKIWQKIMILNRFERDASSP